MIRVIICWLSIAVAGAAHAQTYCGNTTSPIDGSCCSSAVYFDKNGQSCPSAQPTAINSAAFNTYIRAAHLVTHYFGTYQQLVNNNLNLVSVGTPALNGTYPIDARTIANVQGLYFRAHALGTNFAPDGTAAVALYDTSGGSHSFNATQIMNYGDKLVNYLNACSLQGYSSNGGTCPSSTVTIP